MSFIIAALYHFFNFPHFQEARQPLREEMLRLGIKGSLLIAPEGINGTVSGTRDGIDALMTYLKEQVIKGPFEHKESVATSQPFGRAKVRLKKETISLGETVKDPSLTGEYVDPKDWNALISDPDTIVLDARNNYEVHLGTFEKAIDPDTKNFKQLPEFVRHNLKDMKHKKLATFCTGGIRCEKLTPWLREQGFEQVYHLRGGILKYLEEIPEKDSKWQGECYVFDERIAVGHGLVPSANASMCKACGHALTPEDRASPSYIKDVSCPYCA